MLISTWMVDHLDQQELEAVLMHELVHVHRCDYLLNWIALLLRDAFFYLPTSRIAYRQLQHEKELACDDLVVQATKRPLALASALTKVWLHLVDDSPSTIMQTLLGRSERAAGVGWVLGRPRRVIDWKSVQKRVAAGESVRSVARSLKVSHSLLLKGLQ